MEIAYISLQFHFWRRGPTLSCSCFFLYWEGQKLMCVFVWERPDPSLLRSISNSLLKDTVFITVMPMSAVNFGPAQWKWEQVPSRRKAKRAEKQFSFKLKQVSNALKGRWDILTFIPSKPLVRRSADLKVTWERICNTTEHHHNCSLNIQLQEWSPQSHLPARALYKTDEDCQMCEMWTVLDCLASPKQEPIAWGCRS